MNRTVPLGVGLALAVFMGGSPAAEMVIRREADRLVVTDAGGGAVATFLFAPEGVGRPAIIDLAAPGGTIVTRPCPPRPGIDADDHATMHPGVWLGFSDLSGSDPWRHKTAVRFVGFDGEPAVSERGASFTALIDYLDTPADGPGARVVCRERSTITIRDEQVDGRPVRLLIWDARLTPGGDQRLVFGDVEEMGLGVRVATPLSPARGGSYLASHGGRDEKGIFGRRAAWVDASGEIDGRAVGVTIIDMPGNAQEPFFHARDYGLVLANAFGRKAYGIKRPVDPLALAPGETLRLRYAVMMHDPLPPERLAEVVERVRAEPAR